MKYRFFNKREKMQKRPRGLMFILIVSFCLMKIGNPAPRIYSFNNDLQKVTQSAGLMNYLGSMIYRTSLNYPVYSWNNYGQLPMYYPPHQPQSDPCFGPSFVQYLDESDNSAPDDAWQEDETMPLDPFAFAYTPECFDHNSAKEANNFAWNSKPQGIDESIFNSLYLIPEEQYLNRETEKQVQPEITISKVEKPNVSVISCSSDSVQKELIEKVLSGQSDEYLVLLIKRDPFLGTHQTDILSETPPKVNILEEKIADQKLDKKDSHVHQINEVGTGSKNVHVSITSVHNLTTKDESINLQQNDRTFTEREVIESVAVEDPKFIDHIERPFVTSLTVGSVSETEEKTHLRETPTIEEVEELVQTVDETENTVNTSKNASNNAEIAIDDLETQAIANITREDHYTTKKEIIVSTDQFPDNNSAKNDTFVISKDVLQTIAAALEADSFDSLESSEKLILPADQNKAEIVISKKDPSPNEEKFLKTEEEIAAVEDNLNNDQILLISKTEIPVAVVESKDIVLDDSLDKANPEIVEN